jgi:hypothetical protein
VKDAVAAGAVVVVVVVAGTVAVVAAEADIVVVDAVVARRSVAAAVVSYSVKDTAERRTPVAGIAEPVGILVSSGSAASVGGAFVCVGFEAVDVVAHVVDVDVAVAAAAAVVVVVAAGSGPNEFSENY